MPAFGAPGAAAFFNLVLNHTHQGTFGDPFYGGNRNFVGWDLVGYPGVRLAVTPDEQRLDRRPRQLHMSAYDYSMFSGADTHEWRLSCRAPTSSWWAWAPRVAWRCCR